jgi:cell wall-associated NlpC family hydrolase
LHACARLPVARGVHRARGTLRYRCDVAPRWCRAPRSAPRLLLVSVACGALLATSLAVANASPPGIASLRVRVDRIEAQLASQESRSQALAQNYDAVTSRLLRLDASLRRTHNRLRVNQVKLAATAKELQGDAVLAYVWGSDEANSVSIFTHDANQNDAANIYQETVVGNVAVVEAAYRSQAAVLSADEHNLGAQRTQVAVVSRHAATLLAENQVLAVRTNRIVHKMGKALHHLVLEAAIAAARAAARERSQQEAAAGAAGVAGRLGGTAAIIAALTGYSGSVSGSATGSAQGTSAFAAAKTQIGVQYVWGGEKAGVGFDCSGLTQWAWAQAGVSIPRTAAAQYYGLRHVSLSALQPGDLLFYFNLDGDDTVDHVVMYGGSGPFGTQTTIAADYTGTTIALQPAFTFGLIGAARP